MRNVPLVSYGPSDISLSWREAGAPQAESFFVQPSGLVETIANRSAEAPCYAIIGPDAVRQDNASETSSWLHRPSGTVARNTLS